VNGSGWVGGRRPKEQTCLQARADALGAFAHVVRDVGRQGVATGLAEKAEPSPEQGRADALDLVVDGQE